MCSERRKKAFSLLYTKIKHGFLANQSVHRVLSILKFSVNSCQNIEISIEMKSLTLSTSISYIVIIWVRAVLKRTVVGERYFNNLTGVKWIVFIRRWCYISLVHWNWLVSIAMRVLAERLMTVKIVISGRSIYASQLGVCVLLVKLSRSVRSPFVHFIDVVNKSFVRHW